MTVFWFSKSSLTITADGNYDRDNDGSGSGPRYQLDKRQDNKKEAVKFSAQAAIQPEGLLGTIPQIAKLRIGFVQNLVQSTREQWFSGPPQAVSPERDGSGWSSGTTASIVRT